MMTKTRIDANGRFCTCCHKYKLWNQFSIQNKVTTGHHSQCKECFNRKQNLNSKERHLKSKYDLTVHEKEIMYVQQNYSCAICSNKCELIVDHKEGTTIVRGLLCRSCNTGIGLLKHDPQILRNAASYLEK